ncbi:MAG: VWA domain-containing protein [Candidatus Spechtbacterales bacterium]|nr:VWA domain-containing protein [Candidatus Spechtbacterales bacterium]
MFSDLYLGNPEALFLLLFIIPTLYWVKRSYKASVAIRVAFKEEPSSKGQYIFIASILTLMIISLTFFVSSPQIDVYDPVATDSYGEFVFLVDTSRSMAVRPSPERESNLEASQQVMLDVVNNLGSSVKYQVFGYSELAFSLSSLSGDYDYIRDTIQNGLYIDVIPRKGSDIANALAAVASKKIENEAYKNVTHVILFSDGQLTIGDATRIHTAIRVLNEADISVVAVGLGSTTGQRIPVYNDDGNFTGSYERTSEGNVYVSYLQERNLKIIAESTDGRYFHQSSGEELVEYLSAYLYTPEDIPKSEFELVGRKDYGWIPLSIFITALFILSARAGKLY